MRVVVQPDRACEFACGNNVYKRGGSIKEKVTSACVNISIEMFSIKHTAYVFLVVLSSTHYNNILPLLHHVTSIILGLI